MWRGIYKTHGVNVCMNHWRLVCVEVRESVGNVCELQTQTVSENVIRRNSSKTRTSRSRSHDWPSELRKSCDRSPCWAHGETVNCGRGMDGSEQSRIPSKGVTLAWRSCLQTIISRRNSWVVHVSREKAKNTWHLHQTHPEFLLYLIRALPVIGQ